MTQKFNPKIYLNKKRIERAISKNPGISKIWVWNEDALEYQNPIRGNTFVAIKKISEYGSVKELKKTFSTLEQARQWKNSTSLISEKNESVPSTLESPRFSVIYSDFIKNRTATLQTSTIEFYKKLYKLYLKYFDSFEIRLITTITIDDWINWMKQQPQQKTRLHFQKELSLLKQIFSYYLEHDDSFLSPIRPRHRKSAVLRKLRKNKNRFLNEDDFLKFRNELSKLSNDVQFSALATIQYYQALRIGEAAAIHWDDLKINKENPKNSQIEISKSIFYSRIKGAFPVLKEGFKNSEGQYGSKILPLFKASFDTVNKLEKGSGLIFKNKDGSILTYRQIQHAYDKAFKKAGLEFRGTHIMRHGGASRIYDISRGDLAITGQLLGNKDQKTIQKYAHRNPKALFEISKDEWNQVQPENTSPTNPHNS